MVSGTYHKAGHLMMRMVTDSVQWSLLNEIMYELRSVVTTKPKARTNWENTVSIYQ